MGSDILSSARSPGQFAVRLRLPDAAVRARAALQCAVALQRPPDPSAPDRGQSVKPRAASVAASAAWLRKLAMAPRWADGSLAMSVWIAEW
jgi:hypothetical protein